MNESMVILGEWHPTEPLRMDLMGTGPLSQQMRSFLWEKGWYAEPIGALQIRQPLRVATFPLYLKSAEDSGVNVFDWHKDGTDYQTQSDIPPGPDYEWQAVWSNESQTLLRTNSGVLVPQAKPFEVMLFNNFDYWHKGPGPSDTRWFLRAAGLVWRGTRIAEEKRALELLRTGRRLR